MAAAAVARIAVIHQILRRVAPQAVRIPCTIGNISHSQWQQHKQTVITTSGPSGFENENGNEVEQPRPRGGGSYSSVSPPSSSPRLSSSSNLWSEQPDFRKWKNKEAEILKDVEPIISLAKEILHSPRYKDGEHLTDEDEKTVVDKILSYHPHSTDKIGHGLYSIMVDRHPEFRCTRCLFVVRTDGGWIDFSYQKCLRAYIRRKYPSNDAERFIKEHFKRT